MKKIALIIFSLFFSVICYATNYYHPEETFSDNDLTFIDLEIPDSGTITDLNIMVNLDHSSDNGLRYITIQLLSPYGNSVELGHGDQVGDSPYWDDDHGGGNLFNTVFDDEATTSIYNGSPPFAGAYQPDGTLSNFDGQSITGTWQLLISNSSNSNGTVEFTIMVETDSSTPEPYPDYGTAYYSNEETFSDNDLTFIDLEIPDSGTITDLNIMVNLDHSSDNGLRYITIQLLSPYGNSVELGHGDQVGDSPYWDDDHGGGNLFNTVFDDEATTSIYNGSPPFAGAYQPDGTLSNFDGQSITGIWQLLISNSSNSNGTVEFTIFLNIEQELILEPAFIDFGNILIGSDSTNVLKVINNTDSTVTINDITSTEACFTANWVSADSLISAGDSLMIDVTFTPDEIGTINAILTVENSDENKSANLSGNGLGAFITSNTDSLDFGAVEPGYPDTMSVELYNSGNIDLEINEIQDAPDSYFNFISITDSIIPPESSADLFIEFFPQEEGIFNDSLLILSDAYNEDSLFINLEGEAITGNIIDGYAYLDNQTQHDSIKVYFEMQAPDDSTYTVYTDELGYFQLGISDGVYNIHFSKDNYYPITFEGETIYEDITIEDIILYSNILIPRDFATIQEGINNCFEYDTVLVDTGVYVENIDFNGKDITVASKCLITQDTSYISQTVIDGNQDGSVVKFYDGEDSTSILSGLSLTNGTNGGIYCENSSPTIENLVIHANSGSGIRLQNSSPTVCNVYIRNNSAGGGPSYDGGGGIFCTDNSNPYLENVIIEDNHVGVGGFNNVGGGGGLSCVNSNPILEKVVITGNSISGEMYTVWYGSGIDCRENSSPSLVNTIVSSNTGDYGIYVDSGDPTIEYCDFYNNENGNFHGCGDWVGVNVTTNVNGDSCDAWYNIQENPLFVDSANGDFHLTENSPCIDAGDPSSPLDPDGTIADIGAYYYNQGQAVDDKPQYIAENTFLSYPNPITATTNKINVSFSLKTPSKVNIKLYNIKGQLVTEILNDNKPSGTHTISSNINNLSSGIYFIKMGVDGKNRAVKKMVKIE